MDKDYNDGDSNDGDVMTMIIKITATMLKRMGNDNKN